MSNSHVENQVEFTLRTISEKNSLGEFVYKVREFDPKVFVKKYGRYMKNTSFFNPSEQEILAAGKQIDLWILETYKFDRPTLKDYEVNNIVPPVLEDRECVPVMLRPFWDFLLKVNQNKWANFQILKEPIPGLSSLSIFLKAGIKVTSPFTHSEDVKIAELHIKGSISDIDKFIAGVK